MPNSLESGHRAEHGGGLEELLGRDAAPVQAGAAHLVELHDGHGQPGGRAVEGGGVPTGTPADDDHVERGPASRPPWPLSCPSIPRRLPPMPLRPYATSGAVGITSVQWSRPSARTVSSLPVRRPRPPRYRQVTDDAGCRPWADIGSSRYRRPSPGRDHRRRGEVQPPGVDGGQVTVDLGLGGQTRRPPGAPASGRPWPARGRCTPAGHRKVGVGRARRRRPAVLTGTGAASDRRRCRHPARAAGTGSPRRSLLARTCSGPYSSMQVRGWSAGSASSTSSQPPGPEGRRPWRPGPRGAGARGRGPVGRGSRSKGPGGGGSRPTSCDLHLERAADRAGPSTTGRCRWPAPSRPDPTRSAIQVATDGPACPHLPAVPAAPDAEILEVPEGRGIEERGQGRRAGLPASACWLSSRYPSSPATGHRRARPPPGREPLAQDSTRRRKLRRPSPRNRARKPVSTG